MRYQAITQVALIVISLVIIFLVAQPKFESIKASQAEASKYDQAISKVEQYNQALQSLISQAEQIPNSDMDRLLTYLPDSIDDLRVARDINLIVSNNGGVISGITSKDMKLVDEAGGAASQGNVIADPLAGDAAVGTDPAAVGDLTAGADAGQGSGSAGDNVQFVMQTFEVEFLSSYSDMKNILRDFERNAYPLVVVEFDYETSDESDLETFKVTLRTYALGEGLISETDLNK